MISLLQEGAEGVKSGSDFSTISLGVTQFLKSLTRNSPRLVLLEVSKVDTLFSISDSQQLAQIDARGGEAVRILSQVVSVFAKNVKNRFMSEGINITLRHLAVQNDVKKVRFLFNSLKDIDQQKIQECVHWDLHTNFWTTEGATTLSSNASHTICSFNYLSTYAVMQTRNQVTDYNFLAILIGSILLAIAMFSIATIAIIYWRRIKVGRVHIGFQKLLFRIFFLHIHFANFANFLEL